MYVISDSRYDRTTGDESDRYHGIELRRKVRCGVKMRAKTGVVASEQLSRLYRDGASEF